MKPIRIASFNTYLICNRFNNNRVTNPEKRASKIRRDFLLSSSSSSSTKQKDHSTTISNNVVDDDNDGSIPANRKSIESIPDLCFFQEVWGSGIRELTNNIDHDSIPPRRSSLFPSSSLRNNQTIGTTTTNNGSSSSSFIINNLIEMIDTIYFHWLKTGGLYDISKTTTTKQKPSIIKCLYRNKHTFAISRSKSQKGVEATLWDIPQWLEDDNNINDDEITEKEGAHNNNPTKRRLLVFNTHLDPWDTMNRKKQVNEILDFIDDTLRSIEEEIMMINTVVVVDDNDDDDDEEEVGQQQKQQRNWWSNTGVLVVGDFNIKAGSTEYHETLMSMSNSKNDNKNDNDDDSNRGQQHQCNWKDYFFGIEEEDNNENTNTNNNEKSKKINLHQQHHTYSMQNSLAEYPNDCGRIDYIFGIQDLTTTLSSSSISKREYQKHQHQEKKNTNMKSIMSTSSSSSRTFMTLDKVSRSIRKEPVGDESSDHYALILDLIPHRIVVS